jgi:hypothetical protein
VIRLPQALWQTTRTKRSTCKATRMGSVAARITKYRRCVNFATLEAIMAVTHRTKPGCFAQQSSSMAACGSDSAGIRPIIHSLCTLRLCSARSKVAQRDHRRCRAERSGNRTPNETTVVFLGRCRCALPVPVFAHLDRSVDKLA